MRIVPGKSRADIGDANDAYLTLLFRVPDGAGPDAVIYRVKRHSIRINDQYCVCFLWSDASAEAVEITDYHQMDSRTLELLPVMTSRVQPLSFVP